MLWRRCVRGALPELGGRIVAPSALPPRAPAPAPPASAVLYAICALLSGIAWMNHNRGRNCNDRDHVELEEMGNPLLERYE